MWLMQCVHFREVKNTHPFYGMPNFFPDFTVPKESEKLDIDLNLNHCKGSGI